MPSWTSFESLAICGRVEYFCKCNRQLTVQTAKTRKNPGKRFVTCSKCNVYDFLDDDLPSEYYKELLYGMLQKHKQLKKHVDYEQLINVLAIDKSRLKKELKATKSKLKLYDRCYGSNVMCYVWNANASFNYKLQAAFASCKCKQMDANASCKLHLHAASASKWVNLVVASSSKWVSVLQMQAAIARCKCKLQVQANSCKCKLQLQAANACLQMQAAINTQTKYSNNITNCKWN
ncbi:hypothetical protein Tco_0156016 [Tanacetum coccineum]